MPAAKKPTPRRAPSAQGKLLASLIEKVGQLADGFDKFASTVNKLVETDKTLLANDKRHERRFKSINWRLNIICGIVGIGTVAAVTPKISSAIATGQAIAGALLHAAQGHPIISP